MTLTISDAGCRMRGVVMNQTGAGSGSVPAVSIVTRGGYSEFDRPAKLEPPGDALRAPVVSPAEAPPVRRPQ